jgi:hypothetical protein
MFFLRLSLDAESHHEVVSEILFLEEVLSDYSVFALSWKAPQQVNSDYCENLRRTYTEDLQLSLHSLPPRFHQTIQKCLDSIEAILSLPMVLLHRDFGTCNIMVD